MVKYTHKEMMKKLNGRKIFWNVLNQTKSNNYHQYYFDSYMDAKDYFDGCIAHKSKWVLITEFNKSQSGYRTKAINEYPKRK